MCLWKDSGHVAAEMHGKRMWVLSVSIIQHFINSPHSTGQIARTCSLTERVLSRKLEPTAGFLKILSVVCPHQNPVGREPGF